MMWAVVPAAGIGSRFGGQIPKQYWRIGSQTILEHALESLLAYPEIERVVVVLSLQDTVFATLPVATHPLLQTVTGGACRAESVRAGLNALLNGNEASADDLVLVHDAARPCLRGEDLDALARRARRTGGALLAVQARDTLKQASGKTVEKTLNRETIWQAQTPQAFRLDALSNALGGDLTVVTDESSAIEAAGGAPTLVPGHHDNIKVTFLEDLVLAEAALRAQGRI